MKRRFFLMVLALLSACDGNNNEPAIDENGKDRQLILTNWADNIIIPSYAGFRTKFDALVSKNTAFTQNPDMAKLADVRQAWVDAYLEWQTVELFEFGPADRTSLRNFFNIYPTDAAGILANIADPSASLDVPAAYPRQGFPALDYLLNGVGASDADIVSFYTADANAANNIAYLNRLVSRMDTMLTNVTTGWTTYRETFITKTGLDIGSSMGLVVNAYVLNYERFIRSGKFGIPSGSTVATGGTLHPEKVEAYYKRDISLALAKSAHEASVRFFSEGSSFKTYLDALGSKDVSTGTPLSDIINSQYQVISGKLGLLSPSLYDQVQTNNQAMVDVYTQMQKLTRMLKVDMTSAMSVTITYTDNDGD